MGTLLRIPLVVILAMAPFAYSLVGPWACSDLNGEEAMNTYRCNEQDVECYSEDHINCFWWACNDDAEDGDPVTCAPYYSVTTHWCYLARAELGCYDSWICSDLNGAEAMNTYRCNGNDVECYSTDAVNCGWWSCDDDATTANPVQCTAQYYNDTSHWCYLAREELGCEEER